MTTAFEANLPCLNPNCKSYGIPHPNCRCYGFAEGGEVDSFCSKENKHKEDCEYHLAEGGTAPPAPAITNQVGARPAPADTTATDANASITPQDTEPSEFNPLAFVAQHGGGSSSEPSFDPQQFIEENKGTTTEPNEPQANEAPFDPQQFIEENKGTQTAEPSSIIEGLKTAAEGASQGLIGDLAKVAEVKTGLSTLPAIEGRAMDNPLIHDYSKLGGRVASWIGGPADKLMTYTGSRILGNLLAGVSYAGSDAISKSILNQPGGDPRSAVAATLLGGGIDGLMNVATDGLFSAVKYPFKNSPELAQKAMQWLAKKPLDKAMLGSTAAYGLGAIATHHLPLFLETEGGQMLAYEIAKRYMKPLFAPFTKQYGKLNKSAEDALLNAMKATDFFGVPAALEYGNRIASGLGFTKPLEAVFKTGAGEVVEPAKEKVLKDVKDWMGTGGIIKEMQDHRFSGAGASEISENYQDNYQPKFAEGGEIASPPPEVESKDRFAQLYPAENMLLHASRTRVSNYLNTLRPLPQANKATFDEEFSPKEKERSYNNAIEIAANPMGILNDINKGTLTPDKMTHFKSMYPEVHDFMSQKMTQRMIEAQTAKEKPPYNKRQSLSLFLGAPLDGTFTPQSIQAIQGIYAAKQMAQQQQAQSKPKKGTSTLSKSAESYATDDQAREKRLQTQKA